MKLLCVKENVNPLFELLDNIKCVCNADSYSSKLRWYFQTYMVTVECDANSYPEMHSTKMSIGKQQKFYNCQFCSTGTFCSPLGPRIAIIVPCFTYPLTSFKMGLPPKLADMSLNVRLNFSPDCKSLKEVFITFLLNLIIR